MKLIGWDTSAQAGSIVALECEPSSFRLIAEWTLNVDSRHSERLLWGVHHVLESARWKLSDVDVFSVGVGPGSFTGLRIGVTLARTLAHAMEKPLIGVSSLSALARPVSLFLVELGLPHALVIASRDAAKGELFGLWGEARAVSRCVFEGEGEGARARLWNPRVKEKVLSPERMIDSVLLKTGGKSKKRTAGLPWVAVGEGRYLYPDAWERLPASSRLFRDSAKLGPLFDQVQGRYLGMLAWEAWLARQALPALEVHPRYLRAPDAEVKLKAGLLKAAPLVEPAFPARAPSKTDQGHG